VGMAKIAVDWSRAWDKVDLNPVLTRYQKYLKRIGLKDISITCMKLLLR
jgi:hypothetical protein